MVKKVQVPTLLSRAMFLGKPGPSGPCATETPVCPADPALALHGSRGSASGVAPVDHDHGRSRPVRDAPRALRSVSAPPAVSHQECVERCQIARSLVGNLLGSHECPLGRVRPDGSIDMEDLGHPSESENVVHFMEFDDNDYTSMPDAEPGSPSDSESETSMVAFERELEEILSPGLQQQKTMAARNRHETIPAVPLYQDPPSASSSVTTTVRVETPSPDGVVRQIRTTPTPTPKKIPGEKAHADPAWPGGRPPQPSGVHDHGGSRVVPASANSEGCCQTPECCERCRKWQAVTDQRLRSLEGIIEQTVTERVHETVKGV